MCGFAYIVSPPPHSPTPYSRSSFITSYVYAGWIVGWLVGLCAHRFSWNVCHRFLSGALLLLTFWFFILSQPLKPFTEPSAKIIPCLLRVCALLVFYCGCVSLSAFHSPIRFFITIIYMFDTYAQITRKVSKHFYVTSNFIYFYLCVRAGMFFFCPFSPPSVLDVLSVRTHLFLLALIFDRLRNGYRCWVFVDWMILIFAGGGWLLSLSFSVWVCMCVRVCIQGCDSNLDQRHTQLKWSNPNTIIDGNVRKIST